MPCKLLLWLPLPGSLLYRLHIEEWVADCPHGQWRSRQGWENAGHTEHAGISLAGCMSSPSVNCLFVLHWTGTWCWSDQSLVWCHLQQLNEKYYVTYTTNKQGSTLHKSEHSKEKLLSILSWGMVYYMCAVQVGSNIWVCGWNPKVWLFKWKLFSGTFLWCCLLCCTRWF